jgi:release factor glutamine methyltransferase
VIELVNKTGALTVGELLAKAISKFQDAGCARPRFEAEYLLQAALGVNKATLFLSSRRRVAPEDIVCCQSMLDRRLAREPLQYIVGEVEFWSRNFLVTPDVLIPRQETEFVLEQVLSLVGRQADVCLQVLDMGTGSGIIADVLASELSCQVIAVDSSPLALKVAKTNIIAHNQQNRVSLVCSDLFSALTMQQQFDVIVSNPPYVAETEKDDLHPEVTSYEPFSALFAGPDGLDCYRRLIPESYEYLRPGGWLCLEIGMLQGPEIMEMLQVHGYRDVAILSDYAARPRFARGKKE